MSKVLPLVTQRKTVHQTQAEVGPINGELISRPAQFQSLTFGLAHDDVSVLERENAGDNMKDPSSSALGARSGQLTKYRSRLRVLTHTSLLAGPPRATPSVPEVVERFVWHTKPSAKLNLRQVKYWWSRTESDAVISQPLASVDGYLVGDLYLHIGGEELQIWVCQADTGGRRYWKSANLFSAQNPHPTPWPGMKKPLFVSYNKSLNRPTWVLRSSLTTMAGRNKKARRSSS